MAAMRTAHWLLLALALWGLAWLTYLSGVTLPKAKPKEFWAALRKPRTRAPRSGVMIDGVVVPVAKGGTVGDDLEVPPREALVEESQVTLVVAARADDEPSFPRFATLMRSLGALCDPAAIAELLLLAPPKDHGTFSAHAALGLLPFPWRIVDDTSLLSKPEAYFKRYTPRAEWKEKGGRGVGYRVQMLLKLAVAAEVRTEFYVALDCDVLLTQPLGFEDLVRDGRAVFQAEPYPYEPRHDPQWWEAADSLLHAGGCAARKGSRVLGVTPAVLSRSIALRVAQRVEALHGGRWLGAPWDEILFRVLTQDRGRLNWSEYTLYHTAGCEWRAADGRSALEALHVPGPALGDTDATPGPGRRLRLYEEEGFGWGDWEHLDLEKAFGPEAGALFVVVQSIGGAPASWVLEQTEPLLHAVEIERGRRKAKAPAEAAVEKAPDAAEQPPPAGAGEGASAEGGGRAAEAEGAQGAEEAATDPGDRE